MFRIPVEVTINGKTHKIRENGDFRMVLDCFKALEDTELDKTERILSSLIIFYDGLETVDDIETAFEGDIETPIKEMFDFFNCGQSSIGDERDYKLVDWEHDEQLIASAINNVAKTEIRAVEYMHWWTFMGYYLAIGESPLSTVVSIRSKIHKSKKLEKWEKEFRRDNPEYFNIDTRSQSTLDAESAIRQLWENKGV